VIGTHHPIVFVDTETTALGHLARPWEIAVIRREPGGRESTTVLHVQYTLATLPEGTTPQALHVGGWLVRGTEEATYLTEVNEDGVNVHASPDEPDVAMALYELLEGDPIMVGVGVHFDAAVLSSMFRRCGMPDEPWHYGLVELKSAGWARLAGLTEPTDRQKAALYLPMRSERIAAALDVEPPDDDERHTALGDAGWARRWFDRLTEGDR
jgi:DNA polymerase III epsilon subunit-like protein